MPFAQVRPDRAARVLWAVRVLQQRRGRRHSRTLARTGRRLSAGETGVRRRARSVGRSRQAIPARATPARQAVWEASLVAAPIIPWHVLSIAASVPEPQRTHRAREAVNAAYRKLDPELSQLDRAVEKHLKQAPLDPRQTTKAQALVERAKPRVTHLLVRGDFLHPGEEVAPHTPEVLNPLHARGPRPDRLDLAHWLVDPANPLTARVTVNRIWQAYFGRGLVPTSNDFGTQGERPSHPELLGLAGRRVHVPLVEPQGDAPADCRLGDVSAIVQRHAGPIGPRRLQRAVGASEPHPRRGRDRSRCCAWRPAAC